MKLERVYQYNFSQHAHQMYEREGREKKAKTMVAIMSDYYQHDLKSLSLLDVGSSTGIISHYLSTYFGQVVGVDIDESAVAFAKQNFDKENLDFRLGDGLSLDFPDGHFDVVICSQVYEHVPDAHRLVDEIYRVLKPNGICYFAATNRVKLIESHYNLPFLSIMPRSLAHLYLRLLKRGTYYYEKHLSYWGLKNLVKNFEIIDYTKKVIEEPDLYHAGYIIPARSKTQNISKLLIEYAYFLFPGYIWLLNKSDIRSKF
jgi:2-polyprenyl-3-methyl-5-hydroxy-6-metoxy-1,4-benzoquinol methylase